MLWDKQCNGHHKLPDPVFWWQCEVLIKTKTLQGTTSPPKQMKLLAHHHRWLHQHMLGIALEKTPRKWAVAIEKRYIPTNMAPFKGRLFNILGPSCPKTFCFRSNSWWMPTIIRVTQIIMSSPVTQNPPATASYRGDLPAVRPAHHELAGLTYNNPDL